MGAQAERAWSAVSVTASDGVRLTVYEAGPARPEQTVLFVHGYPDDHRVWDGVAERLVDRYRLVSYDVRGAGRSDHPTRRSAYRLGQLARDILTVAESKSAEPIHLVGHDWGSIQSWAAVTTDEAPARFCSFTSISGPDLSYAASWMSHATSRLRVAAARQLLSSSYLAWFQIPVLPDLFWRSGLGTLMLGRPSTPSGRSDAVAGLSLYRANRTVPLTRRPARCSVPVLVLAPRADTAVSRELAMEAPVPWVSDLTVQAIDGGHWTMVEHPERVSEPLRSFLAAHGRNAQATSVKRRKPRDRPAT
ncbi:alpha/beta fold hydrolase [Jatrophihabitans telluris]|uniref:Alpha/beta fold hydrolase n=1 Tax=Jatrophihabitans telluris TaxID=2038343 RepID=A0ABY4QUZ3_9ACTN|nr:alpha/beta fold hydrolase [Jatrophihabitans telluris]UQX86871.1 alpha/beta fold hydrolase [Jatrophihabitans telluris]